MTTVPAPEIELAPFSPRAYPLLWGWLREFPSANFDDYGPATEEEFFTEMFARAEYERHFGVMAGGELVGFVGYFPLNNRSALFHGICFSSKVHGTGIPRRAVAKVLRFLDAAGYEKVSAAYHADNYRVRRFLQKLGAEDEGYLRVETMRDGKPLDKWLVAFHKRGN